jgi:hypothetical protein
MASAWDPYGFRMVPVPPKQSTQPSSRRPPPGNQSVTGTSGNPSATKVAGSRASLSAA